MNTVDHTTSNPAKITPSPAVPHMAAQRKCGCGGSAGLTDRCTECQTQWLEGKPLRTKLRINEPGDVYEQEADRVAAEVMRELEPDFKPGPSQSPANVRRHAAPGAAESMEAAPIISEVLTSAGQPLDAATQSFFASRLGHDFGNVRVHADAAAAESARSVNALAYTMGQDVVFGAGQYAPGSRAGQQLLAHELTHVVQQSGILPQIPEAAAEHRDGGAAATASIPQPIHPMRTGFVQRQPEPESKLRDLPLFLGKLELDVGKNLQDYGHHLYQAATLHPDEPEVLQNALTRYALGLNVLKTSFRFAGFKPDTADKLALGTGILFKSLTFAREGELVLDFQVDLGRGVKFETNLNLGVNPKDVTEVRKAGVNFGLVRRF